jgi:adenylate cyclase class IV
VISEHDEIEAKLAADKIDLQIFKSFVWSTAEVEKFLHVIGPDRYYESGVNVVRHRQDRQDGRHELTVKRRKSDISTRDRVEIDLHFGKKTQPNDVDAFLRAVGFSHVFTLIKEAHIFWLRVSPNLILTCVLYDVWREDEPTYRRRFIEIEAEKGSDVSPETAKKHVRRWVNMLNNEFDLGEPLNDSLYEIYSGKRYQSV